MLVPEGTCRRGALPPGRAAAELQQSVAQVPWPRGPFNRQEGAKGLVVKLSCTSQVICLELTVLEVLKTSPK